MTIQMILASALALLGIPEGSPHALERRGRLLAALDSGILELARCFPIQARCRVVLEGGRCPLPPQVMTPRGLYQDGRKVPLRLEEGALIGADGSYTLVYYRNPPIPSEMGEREKLPYPADLLGALPFYCAAFSVMGEDAALYRQLMEQYNTKLSATIGYRPVATVESERSL